MVNAVQLSGSSKLVMANMVLNLLIVHTMVNAVQVSGSSKLVMVNMVLTL